MTLRFLSNDFTAVKKSFSCSYKIIFLSAQNRYLALAKRWFYFLSCFFQYLAPRSFSLADRKSTRLNSSHANISYAVFCLTKKILMVVTLAAQPKPWRSDV